MAGYTRNDTGNNIADGNIINASDLDGEFDAVEAAFNASTGHTHDGTSAEGAPIEKVGPAQDLVITATEVKPKTDNTLDLGTSLLEFKDLYLDGTANIDSLVADTADINAGSIDGVTLGTNSAVTSAVITTADINGGSVDGATLGTNSAITEAQIDNININGNTISSTDTNGNITLAPNGTGVVALSSTDLTFGDNDKAIFGAGSDLQIYHTGTKSYISDQGTGSLFVLASSFIIADPTDTENIFAGAADGAVNLYYDGSVKLTTTSSGIDVTGAFTATTTGTVPTIYGGSGASQTFTLQSTSGNSNHSKVLIGNAVGGDNGGISFYSAGASVATERMRISGTSGDISFYEDTGTTAKLFWDASAESLGIGTTSPAGRVEIEATSGGRYLTLNAPTDGGYITFEAGGTAFADIGSQKGMTGGTGDATNLMVASRSTYPLLFGTGVTERMRIDSSGNVGIGTSSPESILEIAGSASGTFSQSLNLRNSAEAVDSSSSCYFSTGSGALSATNITAIIRSQITQATPSTLKSDLLFFTNTSDSVQEAMRIDSSGNLLVGTTQDPDGSVTGIGLLSNGNFNQTKSSNMMNLYRGGTGSVVTFRQGTIGGSFTSVGTISVTASATAYNTSSDYRLKEDWVPMEQSIERVKALNPVNFAWKVDGTRVDGFLAHEAQEVVPEAVSGAKDAVDAEGNPEYQGIDQAKLVPLLTAALQEAIGRIETLEAEVAALKGA